MNITVLWHEHFNKSDGSVPLMSAFTISYWYLGYFLMHNVNQITL